MTADVRDTFKQQYGMELNPNTNIKFVAELLENGANLNDDRRLFLIEQLNSTDEGYWANLFKYDTANIENLDLNTHNIMRAFYADAMLDLAAKGYKPKEHINPISIAFTKLSRCVYELHVANFNPANFNHPRPEIVVGDVTPIRPGQGVNMTETPVSYTPSNTARRLF
jgi:hypothetical protein